MRPPPARGRPRRLRRRPARRRRNHRRASASPRTRRRRRRLRRAAKKGTPTSRFAPRTSPRTSEPPPEVWRTSRPDARLLESADARDRNVVLLEKRRERRLVVALRERLLWAHEAVLRELEQAVVHEAHAELASGLHDGRDLKNLGFADEVRDGRHRKHDFER